VSIISVHVVTSCDEGNV